MKYLIDIGHPAHVHYFAQFTKIMQNKGHEVLFTCRDKDVVVALLETAKFRYINFGKTYKSVLGKIWGLFYFTAKLFFVGLKFKPDVYLNASMYAAIVAWLMRRPHISLEDTFNKEQVKLYLPFTSVVLTGDYDHPALGKKEIKYSGYQELLYLHPKIFSPDKNVMKELNVKPNEKFVIMRFVSWSASHDYGHKGIAMENKIKAVKEFSEHAKVIISSESELPPELKPYQYYLSPHKMHDVLSQASLVFGESATMVSEAAMLGVPGIYLDNTGRYYTYDLEKKYGLCFNYSEAYEDQQKAIQKGLEILQISDLKAEWQKKRDKMLSEKIDVTAFMVWFIENYPQSASIMRENPDYQYNFK